MKRLVFILPFLLGLTLCAYSQRLIQKSLNVKGEKVEMKFNFADSIIIEAWSKNVIELEVSVNIDNNLYNDYYEMKVKNQGNNLVLEEVIDFDAIKKKSGDNRNFRNKIIYRLKVPVALEFDLKTISGQIEMKGTIGRMAINSISGFIDYAVPQMCKARIDLSTVTGNVYSNLKFDEKPTKEISWVGTKRSLSLNGGNQDIKLNTVSGDIYLRKGK